MEAAGRLRYAIERHGVIKRLGHDDRVLEAETALQTGFEIRSARSARHDLDPDDAGLPRLLEQTAHLKPRQAEVAREIRHRHFKVVIALGGADHQLLTLVRREPAKPEISIGFSQHRRASRHARRGAGA